jgi:hypothetical protein
LQLRTGVGHPSFIGTFDIGLPWQWHRNRLDDMNEQQQAPDFLRQVCGPQQRALADLSLKSVAARTGLRLRGAVWVCGGTIRSPSAELQELASEYNGEHAPLMI